MEYKVFRIQRQRAIGSEDVFFSLIDLCQLSFNKNIAIDENNVIIYIIIAKNKDEYIVRVLEKVLI